MLRSEVYWDKFEGKIWFTPKREEKLDRVKEWKSERFALLKTGNSRIKIKKDMPFICTQAELKTEWNWGGGEENQRVFQGQKSVK